MSANYKSDQNSLITPLGAGETFTGVWEDCDLSDGLLICKTDANGTIYVDFSTDEGQTADSIFTFNITAGQNEFHTFVVGPRSVRVRFVNGASPQTYCRMGLYFGEFRHGNSPIGFSIGDDADALVVKAVLSGVGNTTASVTDHKALQVTPPAEGKTAFGEMSVSEPSPVLQLLFPVDADTGRIELRENQSGTVSHANRSIVISTGAAANSSAEFRSKRIMKYSPGEGSLVRFTAVFTTGVANSSQLIGIGNESDGLFVGYSGASFGIMHRSHGSPEVRTLSITTKSSTAENITITLDGEAASVAVTNGADATVTANEIAAHDYSDVGRGWNAYAVGSTVVFRSWKAKAHSGAFTLSGATTAVGTFAQNVVGVAPTETFIAQSSWNGPDIFDGNGLTGVTLDPTKGNVYQIKYQWLGYGALFFYIEDPDDGEYHLVHTIEIANSRTTPSMGDPSLHLMGIVENTSNTTDISLSNSSMGGFIEGKLALLGIRRGASADKSSISTTIVPVLSVRQGLHRGGKAVQAFCRMLRVALACEHTKPMRFYIYKGATLVGSNWQSFDASVSSMLYDTSATSISGGEERFVIPLGKSSSTILSFVEDYFSYNLSPGEVLTIAASATSGTGAEATVGVNMLEAV